MRIFLKSFFASLLALTLFTIIVIIVLASWLGGLANTQKSQTGSRAILVLDLGQQYQERMEENPLASFSSGEQYNKPGLYDLVRLLHLAKTDSAVKGIWLKCESNPNGFATSEEIRNALLDFSNSGKFVYAFGDIISQKAYYVASVADRVYCNPKGGVEWVGLSSRLPFLKTALQKLEIEPQIFYAGKFKSATEPLREDKMTDANREQTTVLLDDLFTHLLSQIAVSRDIDSATLRKCANGHLIQYAKDALYYKLVDGLAYDDQIRERIKKRLKLSDKDNINFIPIEKYADATTFKRTGKDKIALIYAEGDIIGGKGDQEQIGDETYRRYIRTARLDKDIRAGIIRIKSGGGSSLASENLWREISITKMEKPVVVSFGDVAASGAYYLSCNADSIFAETNTITGSIGVFSILPNMQDFFKHKLGISFDGVKTAPDADLMSVTKPLSALQKAFIQNQVDSIYADFKSRVSDGRKMPLSLIDSIAQGRVWSGRRGLQLGLVDRIGSLQDAINCAARMAKTTDYRLREYPEPRSFLDLLFGNYKKSIQAKAIQEEIGPQGFQFYQALKRIQALSGTVQTRMPFDIIVE